MQQTNNIELSIVTINYNNCAGLERTIRSVMEQKIVSAFEYVVVDGGSTDGSTDVIGRYRTYIDKLVVEQDNGIYNAMNKGTRLSSGMYCLFLNSGDVLCPISEKYKGIMNVLQSRKDDVDIYTLKNKEPQNAWCYADNQISFYYVWRWSLWHSNTFIKKELLCKWGGYNENYRIVSDWEFFLKAIFIGNCSISFFTDRISENEPWGISVKQMKLHMEERKKVEQELFGRFSLDLQEMLRYKISRWIGIYDKVVRWYVRLRRFAG